MNFINKINRALECRGINIIGEIKFEPGVFQRFDTADSSDKRKSIYVKIFENGTEAMIGSWKSGERFLCRSDDFKRLPPSEHFFNKIQRKLQETREKQIYREKKLEELDSLWNEILWEGKHMIYHPYVIKKKINPYLASMRDNRLAIPLYQADGKICSIQYIYMNGFKQFEKNSFPSESYLQFNSSLIKRLYICEGYATSCSVQEAISTYPEVDDEGSVICAFSASNLMKIAPLVRHRFPSAEIYIMADNDQHLDKNVGIDAALQAAQLANAYVLYPEFADLSSKPTDWNDLHCLEGLEEVRNQIKAKKNALSG